MQTKDIISILGVTNNLLRYYEDQGVIHTVCESNGYRSYQTRCLSFYRLEQYRS